MRNGEIYGDLGKVMFKGKFIDGEKHGFGIKYSKNGANIFEGMFKNGK